MALQFASPRPFLCHSDASFIGEESAVCRQLEQQIHHAPTALRNDNSSKMFEPRQYRDHTTVAFTAAGRIDFVSFRVEVCSEKVAPALHFRERGDWRVFV